MRRKTTKSVWRGVEEIHDRTSFSHTRPRQGNKSRGRCVRFCNRWSVIDEV